MAAMWTKRKAAWMTLVLCSALALGGPGLRAQETTTAADKDTKDTYKPRLLGLPFIYYSPETKLAFGAGSILNFRAGKDKALTRPSTVYAYASYNLAKQFTILAKPEIYVQGNSLIFSGRLRYERTPQLFYGIGSGTLGAEGESYTPRTFAVQLMVRRRISGGLFGGFGFDVEKTTIEKVESGGLLADGTISGSHGGLIAGLGMDLDWDTRDSPLFPLRGSFLQLSANAYGSSAGSDFTFSRVELNLRKYVPMGVRRVLALQGYFCTTAGDVPFYKLPQLGGDSLLRGYYKGRFRDKGLAVLQSEFRVLLSPRLGVVGFAGLADVFPGLRRLAEGRLKFAAGSGVRYVINKRDGTTLRMDMAWGEASFGLYFTAQEAF
jgi:outer membrane protein assembly factor BamA